MISLRSRAARWPARALLASAGTLVGILVLEAVLVVADVGHPAFYAWDPSLGFALNPGVTGRYRIEGDNYVRINEHGMRDVDHQIAKPSGTYRIAVLGDSNAEAFHVQVEQAFWSVMSRGLARCALPHRIEVLNFGVGGYGTAQELLMLRERVWRWSPDAVLLAFFAGNDVADNSRTLSREERPYFVLNDGTLELDRTFADRFSIRSSPLGRAYFWLLERSRVLQIAERVRQQVIARATPGAGAGAGTLPGPYAPFAVQPELYREPSEPAWIDAWRVTDALVLQMAREVDARGARFAVALVSTEVQVHPERAFREGLARELGVADLDGADRRLLDLGGKAGVPVFPLAPELRAYAERTGSFLHGFPPRPPGVGHWNVEGHRIAGELLARHLCDAFFSGVSIGRSVVGT